MSVTDWTCLYDFHWPTIKMHCCDVTQQPSADCMGL